MRTQMTVAFRVWKALCCDLSFNLVLCKHPRGSPNLHAYFRALLTDVSLLLVKFPLSLLAHITSKLMASASTGTQNTLVTGSYFSALNNVFSFKGNSGTICGVQEGREDDR